MATRTARPRARSSDNEAESLWYRLLRCHAIMLAELRRELEDKGNRNKMTLARFDLLASLNRSDGQTLASISRDLLVTAGNVTGLVDRAERDGHVERRAEPSDRRVARVWLTPDGRSAIRALLPHHSKHVNALLEGVPPAERRELRRLLGTLRDHLEKIIS